MLALADHPAPAAPALVRRPHEVLEAARRPGGAPALLGRREGYEIAESGDAGHRYGALLDADPQPFVKVEWPKPLSNPSNAITFAFHSPILRTISATRWRLAGKKLTPTLELK
ncbi:hypothetical protein NKH94_30800 [Mesorhizobium australicum]|uniref:hypothetical protein n=1 Tax=Mesorhizobium australicum TaxID=536018 RepID=UPI003339E7D2